jgi:lysozyme
MVMPNGVLDTDCTITQDIANALLDSDIDTTSAHLIRALPWTQQLDDARQGVLVNLAFNIGVAGLLQFKLTLAAVEAGDYATAAADMLLSRWAKQVGARASRLAKQMEFGIWQ